jgi:hypothetical protein
MYRKHKGGAADPQIRREIASTFVVDGKPLYTRSDARFFET